MPQLTDLSRSPVAFEQDATLIAVIEMGQSNWLVASTVPGIERHPLKKLGADQDALLRLLHRWRNEGAQAGREIKRMVVAYEAGRDGFWLARCVRTISMPTSSIRRASPYRANTGEQKPIVSTRNS